MKIYQNVKSKLLFLGFNPTVLVNFFRGIPHFVKDLRTLKKQLKEANNSDFQKISLFPMMGDWYNKSGSMSGHYFHQDLLVAKMIFKNNPQKHVDIGSRVDGFVAHVAVFREIEVFDIRPQTGSVPNIIFKQADLMKLPENLQNYCDSISSLHAIEHFGLGRYGDPVNVDGHLKGLDNIYQIMRPLGKFYFSVPIGRQRIEFNGHRIFSLNYLLKILTDRFTIDSFSYVDDGGSLNNNVKITIEMADNSFNCTNGCAIFELTKKQ